MTIAAKNIFTQLAPDPIGQILGTGFDRFESSMGIIGLCRDSGAGLAEILAVAARRPGTGQFRRFIERLKCEYQTICIWHVDNPWLGGVLLRYGFKPEEMTDQHGDYLSGYRWDAQ